MVPTPRFIDMICVVVVVFGFLWVLFLVDELGICTYFCIFWAVTVVGSSR